MGKVYEIGTPDHYDDRNCDNSVDCTIWIECPDGYEIELDPDADPALYVKEIEVKPTYPGVDLRIVRK